MKQSEVITKLANFLWEQLEGETVEAPITQTSLNLVLSNWVMDNNIYIGQVEIEDDEV